MQNYKDDGYILVKNFFSKNELSAVKKDAQQIFKLQLEKLGMPYNNESLFSFFKKDIDTFKNCGKHIQHLISLHRLSLNEKIIIKLLELGIKFPNICTRPVLYFNHPKLSVKEMYFRYPAHQDWPSMRGSLNSIVCWVPLVDVNEELGTLQIIPKSHLDGDITQTNSDSFWWVNDIDESKFISINMKKGDVLFFNSFLVHRSGDNISNDIRWSCHFRYNDMKEIDFIERKFEHPYVYFSNAKKNK